MKLDDERESINVNVQCLGKNYPATEAAFKCMNEIADIRKERLESIKTDPRSAIAFFNLHEAYLDTKPKPPPGPVHNMLANFKLTDNGDPYKNESVEHRLARFKQDLRMQDMRDKADDVVQSVKRVFGY